MFSPAQIVLSTSLLFKVAVGAAGFDKVILPGTPVHPDKEAVIFV